MYLFRQLTVMDLLEANSVSSCGHCSCQKYLEEDGVLSETGLAISLLA
jgi:hypothetical protein